LFFRISGKFDPYLRNVGYQDIEQLKEQVRSVIEGFSPEIIASLTGWDYILEALTTVA
ncbi:MAG: hypothetical protein I4E98_14555, partial [Planktothrix agardhii KL2]|nr:hypothetical protein [Planktothrix agardhii KL2]